MLKKSLKQILLKGGKNAGYLGQILNVDLLKDLTAFYIQNNTSKLDDISIENAQSKAMAFMLKNNLKYFGELLERYEERNLIQNTEDFRTLVYAATYFNCYSNIDLVDKQWPNFLKDVCTKLDKNFDAITTAIFLRNLSFEFKEDIPENYQKLILKTIKGLQNISAEAGLFSLSFIMDEYDRLDRLIARLDDNKSEKLQKFKINLYNEIVNSSESIIEKLATGINVIEDYILLYPLTDLYYFFSKPKSNTFKNKKIAPFLAAFEHLKYKEITDSDVSKISAVMNIRIEEIYLLNHIISKYASGSSSTHRAYYKITGPGYERIITLAAQKYLSKNDLLPQILKDEIIKFNIQNYIECKTSRYSSYKECYFAKKLLENTEVSHIENFKFLLDAAKKDKKSSFCFSEKVSYFLINKKNYFDLLDKNSQENIIILNLENTNNLKDYTEFRNLAVEKKINIYNSRKAFYQDINFGYFNIRNFNSINTDRLVSLSFEYIKEFNAEEKAEYLLDYAAGKGITNLNRSEFEAIYKTIGYLVETRSYYSSSEQELKIGKSMMYFNLSDSLAVKLLSLFEELFFMFNPQQYAEYLYSMLDCDWYKKYMNISEDDRENLLKAFVSKSLLSESIRHNIAESFKTEEQKLKEKINSIKQFLNESKDLNTLDNYYKKLTELDNSPEVLQITFKKFKEIVGLPSEKVTWTTQFVKMLKLFASNNILSKDEVFDYVANY